MRFLFPIYPLEGSQTNRSLINEVNIFQEVSKYSYIILCQIKALIKSVFKINLFAPNTIWKPVNEYVNFMKTWHDLSNKWAYIFTSYFWGFRQSVITANANNGASGTRHHSKCFICHISCNLACSSVGERSL